MKENTLRKFYILDLHLHTTTFDNSEFWKNFTIITLERKEEIKHGEGDKQKKIKRNSRKGNENLSFLS